MILLEYKLSVLKLSLRCEGFQNLHGMKNSFPMVMKTTDSHKTKSSRTKRKAEDHTTIFAVQL